MLKSSTRSIDATFLWLLAGLLAFGIVLNVVHSAQGSQAFAEERLIEIELEDDDRDDSTAVDFVLDINIDQLAVSQPWQAVPFASALNPVHFQWQSHFVRGPPSGC